MLNYIWSAIVLLSVVCSIFLGKGENLSAAIVDSGAQTVQLLLTLAGVITLWSGIMKIAEESGLTTIFAKIFFESGLRIASSRIYVDKPHSAHLRRISASACSICAALD